MNRFLEFRRLIRRLLKFRRVNRRLRKSPVPESPVVNSGAFYKFLQMAVLRWLLSSCKDLANPKSAILGRSLKSNKMNPSRMNLYYLLVSLNEIKGLMCPSYMFTGSGQSASKISFQSLFMEPPVTQSPVIEPLRWLNLRLAPEYMQSGRATEKTDVYSFGVLMLEVVSRKRPTYASFIEKGLNVVGWLNYLVTEDRQREIIDENCEGVEAETVDSLLTVAIHCVSSSPEDRPTMHMVVKTLESEVMTPCPSDFYDSD